MTVLYATTHSDDYYKFLHVFRWKFEKTHHEITKSYT